MISKRSRTAACPDGTWLSLTYYPAGGRQPAHRHDFDQLSVVLAGALRESLAGQDHDLLGPAIGHKPAGSLHEDRWGREGTLIFAINSLPGSRANPPSFVSPGWARLTSGRGLAALVRHALSDRSAALRGEALEDIFAMVGSVGEGRGGAPAWLERARDLLIEEPETTIAAAAAAAKVDRAHFSRMFQRHFAVPPSLFRRRVLAARAVECIVGGRMPLAQAAQEAGFCDQAHMSRTMRSEVGLTPAWLRTSLGCERRAAARAGFNDDSAMSQSLDSGTR